MSYSRLLYVYMINFTITKKLDLLKTLEKENFWDSAQLLALSYCITGWPLPYFGHYIGGGDIMHSVCWGV